MRIFTTKEKLDIMENRYKELSFENAKRVGRAIDGIIFEDSNGLFFTVRISMKVDDYNPKERMEEYEEVLKEHREIERRAELKRIRREGR